MSSFKSQLANLPLKPCQTADWNLHRFECKALRRFASQAARFKRSSVVGQHSFPPTAVRAAARLIWASHRDGIEHVSHLCSARVDFELSELTRDHDSGFQ